MLAEAANLENRVSVDTIHVHRCMQLLLLAIRILTVIVYHVVFIDRAVVVIYT